jgi:uncharacterized membrane protein
MEWLKNEWLVLLTSLIPFTEMRGSIPYGILVGFSPLESVLTSLAGNLILIPILLLIMDPVFTYFKTLSKFRAWIDHIEERSTEKFQNYRKWRFFGLMLFVAIPLPTTGVYTGCLIAVLLKMKFSTAWISISLGAVIMASLIGLIAGGVLG